MTDGKAFVLNNGPPEGTPLYNGHRAIWMQEFDAKANKLTGPRKVIVNGGVDISKQPIWIEGPHLYRIKDWYYLMCAEGGTGRGHSEVIFRAKSPWGPYEAWKGNPDPHAARPAGRRARIRSPTRATPTCVQMEDGSWWAVFLASRPYKDYLFNTGRETWLLPVSWKDGWPVILEHGKAHPLLAQGPEGHGACQGCSAAMRWPATSPVAMISTWPNRDPSGCRSTCPNNAGSN